MRTNQRVVLCLCLVFSLATAWCQQTETIGAGNQGSVIVTTSSAEPAEPGENTLSGIGLLPNLNAASRFLSQATFGPDYELIETVSQVGVRDWMNTQLNMPVSFSIEDHLNVIRAAAYDSIAAIGGDSTDFYFSTQTWMYAWWKYVMDSPDLLRARVAFALSQLFVISQVPDLAQQPVTLCNYYDMLIENSFGNFRDLLGDVTRHPAMGAYLTHLMNPKTDSVNNRFPDENYAREIMQLFTIGLYELNQDGTRVLDTAGNPIPTYDNGDIAELAKVFTGFSFWDNPTFYSYSSRESSYTSPMTMWNDYHEPGPKYLINGGVIPDRDPVDGEADVNDALDHLFNHPNVGPFVGRRLIQRLVKSNPTPDYIARVAAAFNDNGNGVRGDMKALISAVLLDPEARNCALIDGISEGMLREPMLRHTNLMRGFNALSLDGTFRNATYSFWKEVEQRPLGSPSVFNFFRPDYQPIGPVADAGLVAPEFQITHDQTIISYANHLHNWTFLDNYLIEYWAIFAGETWSQDKLPMLDLSDENLLSADKSYEELVDRINIILAHGSLNAETQQTIIQTISQIPDYEEELRTRMAIFLTMISPDYLINR